MSEQSTWTADVDERRVSARWGGRGLEQDGTMRRLRANAWMMQRFGLVAWLRYRAARRTGVTIDYAQVLTTDERAILAEHTRTAPWE